jgi:tetratricopeptide (TPR) repeat protein
MRALAIGLALVCLASVASAEAPEDELTTLTLAAADHPDDPALARALARTQLERGQAPAALVTLRSFSARHPEERASLAQLLGRSLYETGELAPAKLALQEAIAHRDSDALAHLYLGLTCARLGERETAALELRRAEALDPRLADSARRVAFQPRERSLAQRVRERLSLSGGSGLEYDTNATLEHDADQAVVGGDQADGRLLYDVSLAARLVRTESSALTLGYRFGESRHEDLHDLDLQSHNVWLSGGHAFGPRRSLRVDLIGGTHRLDGEPYLETGLLGTAYAWESADGGAWRLSAQTERRAYEDVPALPSLERDAWRFGFGLEHARTLALWAPALLRAQLSYARMLTDGDRDVLGFGPAFDSHAGALDLALQAPLPMQIGLELRLALGLERFDAENVVDFLSDDGVGDPDPERRHDGLIEAGFGLARPLTRNLSVEARFRETRHFSNVDLYDWERQLVGTYLRFRFGG